MRTYVASIHYLQIKSLKTKKKGLLFIIYKKNLSPSTFSLYNNLYIMIHVNIY